MLALAPTWLAPGQPKLTVAVTDGEPPGERVSCLIARNDADSARTGPVLGGFVAAARSPSSARSAMLGAGLNRWMTDALIELYQDYRRSGTGGYAAVTHDTVRQVTGSPPRTLDQALADDLTGSGGNQA